MTRFHQSYDNQSPPQPILTPFTAQEEADADIADAAASDWPTIDQNALNAALSASGSVVRALGLVMFAEINKLRVAGGSTAYTMAQFVAALKAQMR